MRADRKMSPKYLLSLDIILVITLWQTPVVVGTVSNVKISGHDFVDEGSSATFTCTASCTNTSCTFAWSEVANLINSTITSSTLTLPKVSRKPGGGNYTLTCTASDNNGPAKTATHSLAVYYGPDKVTLIPSSGTLTVLVGTTYLEFAECTAVNCYPSCTIRWHKGSVQVSTNQRLYESNIVATRDHAGQYKCFATNPKRSTETSLSSNLSLIVEYPPDVNATWDSGTNTLTCTASGVPASYTFKTFSHSLNSIKIRDLTGSQKGQYFTHTFTALTYQDRGDYKCSVSNGKPTSNTYREAETRLSKDEKPLLVDALASYNVSKGASLQISLSVYAIPSVLKNGVTFLQNGSKNIIEPFMKVEIQKQSVTVAFHGKNVGVDGQKVILKFDSVLEEYFGASDVKIANTKGHFIKSITLNPQGAPDPPEDLQISEVSHDKMTLTFRSGFFNGASQTFVVEYKTTKEGSQWTNGSFVDAGEEKNVSFTATISGLSPETSYMTRAYGFNMYDRSNYVTVVNTTTLAEPTNVGLIVGVTLGSVAFIAIIIVVVVVVICWKRRKRDKQDANKGTHPLNNQNADMVWPPIARDNNAYSNTGENYENTRIENGQTFTSNQQREGYDKQGTNEPLYENNQIASNSVGSWKKSDDNFDSDNSLETEGYLDLSGGNAIEDAYATRDVANMAHPEEDYLNVDVVQAITPKLSFRNLERKPSKPQYQNVSKEIGLIGQPQSNNDEPDETYLDMDEIQTKPSVRYKKYNSEEPYMAMSGKGTPTSARHIHKKSKEKSQYQNLHNQDVFDTKPTPCQGDAPYVSMSKKTTNRDSLPSYHAPPPPAPLEEDYMNIQMSFNK